ncbi:hypothetical protein DICVIV_08404 [Dictyocaulus viviparus]|uniref:Carboxylesterase type B domain-containing protein n=1 Tax=Dictyocaulus viviparus TaxID=29172 RepID=A0A0D8XT16_DICVI|nr:hypothetical protein DICVIV_08404 [Dictyocaulus viviparus]
MNEIYYMRMLTCTIRLKTSEQMREEQNPRGLPQKSSQLCFKCCDRKKKCGVQLETIWVEQGLVRGKIYNIDGRHIQIFRGIPYAEPPIGNLRFSVSFKLLPNSSSFPTYVN